MLQAEFLAMASSVVLFPFLLFMAYSGIGQRIWRPIKRKFGGVKDDSSDSNSEGDRNQDRATVKVVDGSFEDPGRDLHRDRKGCGQSNPPPNEAVGSIHFDDRDNKDTG